MLINYQRASGFVRAFVFRIRSDDKVEKLEKLEKLAYKTPLILFLLTTFA